MGDSLQQSGGYHFMTRAFLRLAVCCLALPSGILFAQDASSGPVQATPRVVPALTPVRIEILEAQGSAISKPDAHFPIRLVDPVLLDGKTIIPAGATGEGEVVHAKKSSMSGGPGELILAARWLDVNGHQVRLRSMHLSENGKSSIKDVNRIMIASAATVPVAAMLGWFMKGKEVVVPSGTYAEAKLAADFSVEP
ncbi:hypothetical protein FHW92_004244 [Novosphingobium sp. SG707]|nr:hypothetical protein [Novosphingobium sp. SG707]